MNPATAKIRQAILDKDKNHEFGSDGFCIHCHRMHRTDWRKNDLCPTLLKKKKVP
jgi:hypothetical protein